MHSRIRNFRGLLALIASAGLVLGACSGTASSAPIATPPPSAAAGLDPCLVGTWTVVAQSQSSPANDEQITYSGGAGEIFTIDATGRLTIDTHAAQPLVLVDSSGGRFTGTVTGTGKGTVTTSSAGGSRFLNFEPSTDDTRKTLSVDSTGTPLGPARPDTAFEAAYTCAAGRFTFYKDAVNYMVDGPIVTLTAGVHPPSVGPSQPPSPSPSASPA